MCDGCIGGQRERVFCVHAALGKALRYICEHDAERAYAFDLAKEELQVLSDLAEQFVLRQADRNFQCLQYYKSVMKRE